MTDIHIKIILNKYILVFKCFFHFVYEKNVFFRSACMSSSSVMAGMLYTNRLRKKNPTYLQQVSSSDLFLISMVSEDMYQTVT